MFINNNSLVINGVNMGQYVTEIKFAYPKLWGSATGRNLAGVNTGTFIGVFPKLTLTFRKLTKEEMEVITPILDSPTQTVTYYDPTKQTSVTMTTYTGDYEYTNKTRITNGRKNDTFSCSFIPVRKRA